MPLTIAVTNQKGGVGKTTTTINVAGALAAAQAVPLVVDLDPQGYATEAVGADEYFRGSGASLFDALTEPQTGPTLDQLAVDGAEFQIVPSHISLTANDIETRLAQQEGGRRSLQQTRDRSDLTDIDIILIDCPPRLGPLTDAALLACDYVLIPSQPRHTARRALELLVEQIESLVEHYGETMPVAGVVANEAQHDGVSDQLFSWLEDEFGDIPVWEVRKRVALQRAYEAGLPIHAHEEYTDMEAVYDEIAEHLLTLRQPQEVPADG